jgi:hypothetical protein
MKVSDSVPSEIAHPRTRYAAAYAIALAYLLAHLPFLASSLEDIDSINFALGLHHFDPALHQPHPPGYPVYIALGRLSLGVIHLVAPSMDPAHADALALAIWSAIGGALALVAAASLFRSIGEDTRDGVPDWAVALIAASPVFWMTGLRPMSDMIGLAAALTAQALLVRGTSDRRAAVIGALVAGLAAGIRSQTLWLTTPVLVYALVRQRRAGLRWLWQPVAALTVGGIVWAVPLVIATGGIDAYLKALGSQAEEDLAGVTMVWTNPSLRRVAFAAYDTFVRPWNSVDLARVMGAAAVIGAAAMWFRNRRALLILTLAFVPYALFHLVYQETVTVRYSLPLVVPIAYGVATMTSVFRRLAPVIAALIVVFALIRAVPGGIAYAREPHPAFRAIADMRAASSTDRPGGIYAHYALRRPLQTAAANGLPVVEPRRTYEWLGPVEYWLQGGTAPIWFLADPRRTDLDLIDPAARHSVRHYTWSVARNGTLSGTRPTDVDWYRLQDPGWFVGEGWSLTPETSGIAAASGARVDHQPIDAYVRRRDEAAVLMIGGRHFGTAQDPAAAFELALDGRVLDRWTVNPAADIHYLRVVELPAGSLRGDGRYARVRVTAAAAQEGERTPPVAVEQFDVQSSTGLMHAFATGWHEDEYDPATGRRWRWTSDHAELRIIPPQGVRLTIRAESPVKYFHAVPTVRVRAGGRVISELRPSDDFTWEVTVPAADVRSDGILAIETDRVYLPGPAEGTADARRLGLRVFELRVDPLSEPAR